MAPATNAAAFPCVRVLVRPQWYTHAVGGRRNVWLARVSHNEARLSDVPYTCLSARVCAAALRADMHNLAAVPHEMIDTCGCISACLRELFEPSTDGPPDTVICAALVGGNVTWHAMWHAYVDMVRRDPTMIRHMARAVAIREQTDATLTLHMARAVAIRDIATVSYDALVAIALDSDWALLRTLPSKLLTHTVVEHVALHPQCTRADIYHLLSDTPTVAALAWVLRARPRADLASNETLPATAGCGAPGCTTRWCHVYGTAPADVVEAFLEEANRVTDAERRCAVREAPAVALGPSLDASVHDARAMLTYLRAAGLLVTGTLPPGCDASSLPVWFDVWLDIAVPYFRERAARVIQRAYAAYTYPPGNAGAARAVARLVSTAAQATTAATSRSSTSNHCRHQPACIAVNSNIL
jgi:hypothetical protein